MASAADPPRPGSESQQLRIRPLLPADEPAGAAEIVQALGLWDRPAVGGERPYVLVNMVSTVDGRASLEGRSGPIAGPADRELFHALRTAVDAVMAGAGTMRVERYGRLIRDEARRLLRRERGLSPEPLACIVTASLALPPDLPVLAEPEAHVVVLTPSDAELMPSGARLDYVRAPSDGELDLTRALSQLRERFGVELLLCEGGPHLNGTLLAAGLVDELWLCVSPKLAGGDPTDGEALRVIAGEEFEQPLELALLSVLEHDSHLFLRYGVSARARVSRATTDSSSLAS
ncbi:MAG TPA: dihydrofolate reductase family protein [Solirubrobacteraceae bacterium]|nr:dihydrofolate reductase family protein [Solirubrobacteraceae bacterium]